MTEVTCWIGYLVVVAAAILAIAVILGLALNFLWEKIRDGRNLWWMNKAIRHYEKIESRPTKDES
jgi:hypothetical protein